MIKNRAGFRFGFELEVFAPKYAYDEYDISRTLASKVLYQMPKATFSDRESGKAIGWDWCQDGQGPEFKNIGTFQDLDLFMESVTKLVGILKEEGAHVSARKANKNGWDDRATSMRGIHIHVSHPKRIVSKDWPNTDSKTTLKALNMLPHPKADGRMTYAVVRASELKYSAIRLISSDHLELRVYNATLNARAISLMLENAYKVAEVMFKYDRITKEPIRRSLIANEIDSSAIHYTAGRPRRVRELRERINNNSIQFPTQQEAHMRNT